MGFFTRMRTEGEGKALLPSYQSEEGSVLCENWREKERVESRDSIESERERERGMNPTRYAPQHLTAKHKPWLGQSRVET